MSYMRTPTSSSSKSEFTALTLWLNREREAFPHLKRDIVSFDNLPTPKMPGHYTSPPSERKRKSLGLEMGFYELMLEQEEEKEETTRTEVDYESFEASCVLALSPDVSLVEQERNSRQIIVVEMEEEEEEEEGEEEEEYGQEQEQEQYEDNGVLSTHIYEECGHFLDPVEEVTEEPTIIEWEEEERSTHTLTPKRIKPSETSFQIHDWARLHGLGTPSSIAPSPAASRFGWAEVIAQTRLQEMEERNKPVTIFSPFSPAKAMGLKTEYWLMSPTKPTLAKTILSAKPEKEQNFSLEKADQSDDSLGWIEIKPVAKGIKSTFNRKTKWATIIPDRFASLRSRSSSR